MERNIELVMAPCLYKYHSKGGVVVLIDVARFTTTMITALANGAVSAEAYPNSDIPLRLKAEQGYVLSGENRGCDIPGFDFNNSPLSMTPENVSGRKLAFTTTNGTYTRSLIDNYDKIFAGAFVNASALVKRLIAENKDVKLVCSGRGRRAAVEDTIFAGYIAKRLIEEGGFVSYDDSVYIGMVLYEQAKGNLLDFVLKNSPTVNIMCGRYPLYKNDLDTVFVLDKYDIVPEEVSPLKFEVR
ncbi:MAG: 2-phosphosulfolactate phosphatase [Bacteroidales bacterium]|nr:2-phosphosulfolactate phosphatase [Bacteroidales bacterium]